MQELPEEKIRQMWAQYMGLCAYVDFEAGRLLSALEKQGLAENTIVIYSADHGKGLGEWGASEKGYYDSEVWRVPMIWSWPGHIPEGRKETAPCELLDTAATLMNLTEMKDIQPGEWKGRDLFNAPAPEGVFSEWMSPG
jgi:arylsulfatase A-like enzyme